MAPPTYDSDAAAAAAACQSKFFLSAKWRKIWFESLFNLLHVCCVGRLPEGGTSSRYTRRHTLAFKCTPFNWCLMDNQSYGAGGRLGLELGLRLGLSLNALNSANIIQSTLDFDSMRIRCVWGSHQSSYRCVGPLPPLHGKCLHPDHPIYPSLSTSHPCSCPHTLAGLVFALMCSGSLHT